MAATFIYSVMAIPTVYDIFHITHVLNFFYIRQFVYKPYGLEAELHKQYESRYFSHTIFTLNVVLPVGRINNMLAI